MADSLLHCCATMTQHVNNQCEQHTSVFDCPDALVFHNPHTRVYGIIIHDGGTSYVQISHCPWCGAELPAVDSTNPPRLVGGAHLRFFVIIDNLYTYTGNTKHYTNNHLLPPMQALALCQYENDSGFYLFGCDLQWNTITDTYHDTLEEAFEQATFEYAGLERHHWHAVEPDVSSAMRADD
jgi:hypothetical protein